MSPLASWLFLLTVMAFVLAPVVAWDRWQLRKLRDEADRLFAQLCDGSRFVDWRSLYLPDEEDAA